MTTIVLALSILACTDDADPEEVARLNAKRADLTHEIEALDTARQNLIAEQLVTERALAALRADAGVLAALRDGEAVSYIFHMSIRQVSASFALKKQLRDAINEQEFDLITDRPNYERAKVGDDLFSSFRAGSMLLNRSAGSWRLRIESKRIEAGGQEL